MVSRPAVQLPCPTSLPTDHGPSWRQQVSFGFIQFPQPMKTRSAFGKKLIFVKVETYFEKMVVYFGFNLIHLNAILLLYLNQMLFLEPWTDELNELNWFDLNFSWLLLRFFQENVKQSADLICIFNQLVIFFHYFYRWRGCQHPLWLRSQSFTCNSIADFWNKFRQQRSSLQLNSAASFNANKLKSLNRETWCQTEFISRLISVRSSQNFD